MTEARKVCDTLTAGFIEAPVWGPANMIIAVRVRAIIAQPKNPTELLPTMDEKWLARSSFTRSTPLTKINVQNISMS